jgi:hypothetical protein
MPNGLLHAPFVGLYTRLQQMFQMVTMSVVFPQHGMGAGALIANMVLSLPAV